MTIRNFLAALGLLIYASSSVVYGQQTPQAQADQGRVYNEPTRGFLIERGNVYETKKISVDVASGGAGEGNSLTGEVRAGVPGGELSFRGSEGTGMGTYKFGLPGFDLGDSNPLDWSVYGGFGYQDLDDAGKAKFFRAGLPITMSFIEQRLLLSVVPEFYYYNVEPDVGDDEDGTILSLGLGGYYNVADTDYGKVQIGLEYVFNEGDDDGYSCADDNSAALGVRWLYNERVNMDFVFYQNRCDRDSTNIPGFARINIVF